MKKNLLTFLALVALTSATMAQVPSYVPTNGLVGYWPFNGNANDESGNGNNGTVNGATLTTDRFGNANAAYDFDGNSDFIEVTYSQIPDFSNGITMQAWVLVDGYNTNYPCPNQSPQQCAQYFISSSGDGSDSHYGLSTNQWSGYPFLSGNLAGLGVGAVPSTSTHTIPYTSVRHVVYTFDNSTTRLYIDGVLSNTLSYSTPLPSPLHNRLKIGRLDQGSPPYYTNGQLDDIGIWNRALSACEIEQLYLGQVIPQPSAAVTTSGSTTFCQGGSVTLSVPQADNYLWSNGATSQSITVNSTGTYNVTVTNANYCSETSQNINVTVNSLPNVSLGSFSSICDNAPSVSLAGGLPSGGSYLVNGVQSTELNPSVTGSGMQTVVYEYTDNNGCSNSATQTVMVNQSPSVSVSGLNTTYSPTDPAVQLNGTPSGGVYSGTGVTNDGVFDPAVAGIGTHNVQYVYVDGNGCVGVDGLCTTVDMNMNIGGGNIDAGGGTIDVYPNPSNGNVTVSVADIEGVISLSVFDVRGREVFSTAMVGNGQKTIQNIDLSNYANGVYTLSIRTTKGTATQKLVKE